MSFVNNYKLQNSGKLAVVDSMLWLPKACINIELAKKLLVVDSYFKDEQPAIKLWEESSKYPEYLGVPRNYGAGANHIPVTDCTSQGRDVHIDFTKQLRPLQVDLMEQVKSLLKVGHKDFLIEADTGFGKTVFLIKLLSLIGKNALVVLPQDNLLQQWKQKILEFTSLTEDDIGHVQQDVCNYKDKKIVLGIIHSLCKDKYGDDFNNHFGVLCVDEAHRASANKFSEVLKLFSAKYRFGVSARLNRKDGLSTVIYQHLGGKVVQASKSEQPVPLVVVSNFDKSSGNIPSYITKKIYKRANLLSKLALNVERNQVLVNAILRMRASGRRVLVLSDRINQLVILDKLLEKKGVSENDRGIYIEKTVQSERDRIVAEAQIILATYHMLSTGVDIKDLRGLVYATPISDNLQALGRIRRICPNTEQPAVFDLVDTTYRDAITWFDSRSKTYNQLGCKIMQDRK